MAIQTIPEKLQLGNEKNILIQGLPSSVEKPFSRINYNKSVTPLLRSRKIEFALIFAVNEPQLESIMADVVPALNEDARLWVAIPKSTSKIYSTLCRDYNWEIMSRFGFCCGEQIALDSVWSAISFNREDVKPVVKKTRKVAELA